MRKRNNEDKVLSVALETKKAVAASKARAAARPKRVGGIPKGMKVGAYIQQEVQRILHQQDPKAKDTRSRLESLIEATYKRAVDMRSGQGKASTELLLAYGYEKPKPAVDELDAMAKSGFQVVHVYAGGLEGVEKTKALPEPTPNFIDAEIVEDEDERK